MIRGDRPSSGLYSVDSLAYLQDRSLIHEFLHLVFREMDATVDDALQLIADDKAREVFQGRMTMRQEQVAERLTQIFARSVAVDRGILDNPTFHDKSYAPDRSDPE